jgi:hypothetical protein
MNKKFFAILMMALVVVIGFSVSSVAAKNDKNNDIPEENGIYDVPNHPDLKVRVFVHKAKPSPQPQPTYVCNLDDNDSSAVVGSAGWKLPSNWTYNLNLGSVPSSVGSNNLPTISGNAFAQWTNVLNDKVSIIRGSDTKINKKGLDGKNIITWGSASGSALGVTYIWYNPTTEEVRELDTIMNQNFFWKWSNGVSTCAYINSYDAQDIMTHELGHWFGLDDEYTSAYTNNTMYGYGSTGDAKADTLTTGDILGVQAIY